MMGRNVFKVILLDEAGEFLYTLPKPVYKKILYNIDKIASGERDAELFKKLENTNIWEFRTLYNKMSYRLFAFWDKDTETMVVATHGIVKKTRKTPQKEIDKAEAIRRIYFNNKNE